MSTMLSVSSDNHGDVVVIRAVGDVDATTAGVLREALTMPLASGRVNLVADLSQVQFMDSSGLGVLVGRLKAARQVGGGLRCLVTTDRIRRIFNATGLERVLPLYDSAADAVAAFDVPQS